MRRSLCYECIMNSDDLTRFKAWFADYVAAYYTDDPVRNRTIRLKQEHTERVCKEIIMLGHALNLSKEEMLLAEAMALFHDLGRFEQYAVFGTFKDSISENHAELGLKELARHKVLSICSGSDVAILTRAIRYHNVRAVPDIEDDRCLFFTRLLRDADKLDIWRVFIDYYKRQDKEPNPVIVCDLPDKPTFTPKILNALRLKKIVDLKDMATLNDFKLLQISWVFDLNFGPTFRAVSERQYIQTIAATLPQTKEIARTVPIVEAYLKERKAGPQYYSSGE